MGDKLCLGEILFENVDQIELNQWSNDGLCENDDVSGSIITDLFLVIFSKQLSKDDSASRG
jgi:hypothetical protein